MRSFLIVCVCLAALAGGALLAGYAANHFLAFTQAGRSVYGAVESLPPAAPSGPWVPPAAAPAHPNWTWHMPTGKTFNNVVITHLGSNEVTITHSLGVAHLPLDLLPPDVQAELGYPSGVRPAGAPVDAVPVATLLEGKLVDASGHPVPAPGADIKFYALYYSGAWCPSCTTFTPTLVQWYRQFKPAHAGFEVIYVSEDRSEAEMEGFMNQTQMPWPAVRYADLPRINGTFRGPDIQQFAHDGIPDLVLVDALGKVIADSYSGTTYLGPQTVLDYMNQNLGAN